MQGDETAVAATSEPAGFDDIGDEVDLSFAGPEPAPAATWPQRLLDVASAYLPLLLMAALAGATWWLVRNGPAVDVAPRPAAVRHEPDYVMTTFMIRRFGPDGALRTQIEGAVLRHYPDTDTLEVDDARIHAYAADGVVTEATARRALANGDGSEVQLIGDARVLRPAAGKQEAVEFRGEFFAAFRNIEQVRSHLPVVMTQGASVVHAEGMQYDNLAHVVELKGKSTMTLDRAARPRAAR